MYLIVDSSDVVEGRGVSEFGVGVRAWDGVQGGEALQ